MCILKAKKEKKIEEEREKCGFVCILCYIIIQ